MSEKQSPEQLVAELVSLLTVSRDGEDAFTAPQQAGGVGRVFGGQVIAQALQAAQATAPDGLEAHSLHAYFLRGGKEGVDIAYRTARDFDGRSFANRRVVASQADDTGEQRAILNLTASFQRPEDGLSHDDVVMPDVAAPEELKSDQEMRRAMVERAGDRMGEQQRALVLRPRPIDMRTVDQLHWMNSEPRAPRAHTWFRTVSDLPSILENPALHRAIIAYASDYTLLGTSALPHGLSWMRGELVGASLDHAIWFHRPADLTDWVLSDQVSPSGINGRGLASATLYNRAGQLVCSTTQEMYFGRRRG